MPGLCQRKLEGHRFSDTVSFAVISRFIPCEKINEVLESSNKSSKRKRLLPAYLMVYYVIALGFYFESSSRDVLRFLLDSFRELLPKSTWIPTACKSAISQARTRIGKEPLIKLYDELVQPIATKKTQGAFFKNRLLVAMDGSTIEVADSEENIEHFGKPKYGSYNGVKGEGAYPLMRFLALVELGTHVVFEANYSRFSTSEFNLGKELLDKVKPNMLVLADRMFFNYETWEKGVSRGADLLWRIKKNIKLEVLKSLADGSYLSKIYPTEKHRSCGRDGINVRVVEYKINNENEVYRLITTLLDHNEVTGNELASLYSERWRIETVYDELKNHTREKKVFMRSKTPNLVIQEFYGLLLAHYAIRGVMHEAAVQSDQPPNRLSFTHSVRVVRRRLKGFSGFSP